MSLMGTIIVGICVGTSGNVRDACTHGLDAGSRQTGIDQQVGIVEKRGGQLADRYAEGTFGEKGKETIGGLLFIAKTVSERSLDVPLPTMGLWDQMTAKFQPQSVSIGVRWSF